MLTPWTAVEMLNDSDDGSWAHQMMYWKRDTLAVLQEILDNSNLADKCVWAPSQRFSSSGERVYMDMDTCE